MVPTATPALDVQGVVRRYGASVAVDEVSLAVAPGEVVTMLGPSGCGKSTLLRAIAGIDRVDGGRILIGGTQVAGAGARDVPPERRHVGMVFQNYALWPHMTVAAHVEYPLRRAGVHRAERTRRVAETLATVQLSGFERRYPGELSGGQQQRVSLARAIAADPTLVLMDEPLSNLDAQLRDQMREEIKRVQLDRRLSMVYVTHDQMEALALSDRVAVMRSGKIVQCGPPEVVYHEPATAYVAAFLGASNALRGRAVDEHRVRLDSGQTISCRSFGTAPADDVVAMSRPGSIVFVAADTPGSIPVDVLRSAFLGGVYEHTVRVGSHDETMLVRSALPAPADPPGVVVEQCFIYPNARP